MTQDNDDLLAQVFSVLPTLEANKAQTVNSDRKQEDEMVANVRRVSNAFHDFIEKSGVVETHVTHEHHESHHEVITHVESHQEIVIGSGVQIHREEHQNIGHGASVEVHSAEHHEESHAIGFGASVISTEMSPPEEHHTTHFGIEQVVAPHQEDEESIISVRSGLSKATSVSVHSSVSQKSAQVFNDAPVIVKATSHHSLASNKSSVVPESHHSEVTHTHDQESTISLSSKSSSTLTGSEASKNTAIEQYVISAEGEHEHHHHHHHHHAHHILHHETASVDSTPIAPVKSGPHDALIEEFKLRHPKASSEVSSIVVAPVSAPPPPPTVPPPSDSDVESDVFMPVKVTEYEFDSNHVKQVVEHHHEKKHHEEPIHVEHHNHNGFDSHEIGHGAQFNGSGSEFEFEHVDYEDIHHEPGHQIHHEEPSFVPAQPPSEVPPVFFNSPVLTRKMQQPTQNLYDTVSEASSRLHQVHSHHHKEIHEFHHSDHHHEDVHHIHRVLVPNVSGPHVREDLRPVHIVEEHHTNVIKTIPTPVAHVTPVVSEQGRGLPRIDHREVLTPIVDTVPIVHKNIEVEHHYHQDHDKYHQRHVSREEKHYHKHDDQMSEVLCGPSVKDLKSRFEVGGEVKVHYGTHYISHKRSSSAPIHVENSHEHHHEHSHSHHHKEPVMHHHHEEHHHHHHEEPIRHEPVSVSQPRLSHREVKKSHHHHHEEHAHKHHHKESIHHHTHHEHHHVHHNEPVHHRESVHHHEPVHHHEEPHHHREETHHHMKQHDYAEEEDQLPVSVLLSRYGGGAKLRRPDHFEKIEIYSRSSSVPNVTQEAPHHQHEEQAKPRTVTQSSVTTRSGRSHSTYSVQTSQRSHASTLTHENHHNHVAPISPAAPIAAARNVSSDHQSLRVVKSVRAFINEWGQKEFCPPMSPIITVPRLPSSPKEPITYAYPEPVSRKSTVISHVSHTTSHTNGSERQAIQQIEQAIHDDASVCSQCSHPAKRLGKSVSSVASTVSHNGSIHHEMNGNHHIGEGVQSQIPEVHEEFVLTPLSERRAIFEQGLNRGYSINRKTHGELPPMVNVFTK